MKRVEFNTIQGSAPLYINTGLKVKSVEMKIFAYACIHTYVRMYVHILYLMYNMTYYKLCLEAENPALESQVVTL